MGAQLPLTFTPSIDHLDAKEVAALAFHRANPSVWDALIAVCLRMRQAGMRRWSINAAFEVVRYDYTLRTRGEPWKLNNTHRAYYARWLMREVPALAGLFETRTRDRAA